MLGHTKFKPGLCATYPIFYFFEQTHPPTTRHVSTTLQTQPTSTIPLSPRVRITESEQHLDTSTSLSVKGADQLDPAELRLSTCAPVRHVSVSQSHPYGMRAPRFAQLGHVAVVDDATLSEPQSSPPIRCYFRLPGADTCPILSSPCTCATWRALNLRACFLGSKKSPFNT
ncbi:hypothetical protein L3X38_044633 [Prunus dulcis]|uniref:Uncharacterized protein n=1 Tax=Prunus dulcis TaxID=3755 RepID=A0AAD4YMD7_PRUDU|nr:hypothetical protein L3X38_044633 [Prunus dulcis]